jgi:hypothetical protein
MRVGDTIPIRRDAKFRVVGVVAGDEPTLIVEWDSSPTDAA